MRKIITVIIVCAVLCFTAQSISYAADPERSMAIEVLLSPQFYGATVETRVDGKLFDTNTIDEEGSVRISIPLGESVEKLSLVISGTSTIEPIAIATPQPTEAVVGQASVETDTDQRGINPQFLVVIIVSVAGIAYLVLKKKKGQPKEKEQEPEQLPLDDEGFFMDPDEAPCENDVHTRAPSKERKKKIPSSLFNRRSYNSRQEKERDKSDKARRYKQEAEPADAPVQESEQASKEERAQQKKLTKEEQARTRDEKQADAMQRKAEKKAEARKNAADRAAANIVRKREKAELKAQLKEKKIQIRKERLLAADAHARVEEDHKAIADQALQTKAVVEEVKEVLESMRNKINEASSAEERRDVQVCPPARNRSRNLSQEETTELYSRIRALAKSIGFSVREQISDNVVYKAIFEYTHFMISGASVHIVADIQLATKRVRAAQMQDFYKLLELINEKKIDIHDYTLMSKLDLPSMKCKREPITEEFEGDGYDEVYRYEFRF